MRTIAILRFGPVFGPISAPVDQIQPALRPRRAAVLERLIGRLAALAACAARLFRRRQEEMVEGPSDLLPIAALQDLRVDLQVTFESPWPTWAMT